MTGKREVVVTGFSYFRYLCLALAWDAFLSVYSLPEGEFRCLRLSVLIWTQEFRKNIQSFYIIGYSVPLKLIAPVPVYLVNSLVFELVLHRFFSAFLVMESLLKNSFSLLFISSQLLTWWVLFLVFTFPLSHVFARLSVFSP